MRKRFLNAVLFATAFATAAGTLVSCKDYDDDIASLQDQINQKATAADLTAQLSTLSNDLNSVKSSLNSQVDALKAEIEAAKKGQDATSAELVKNLEAKLAELNKTVDAKLAAVDAASAKIDKLTDEIKKANAAELAKLSEQVDAVTAQVAGIVGHRLSSIALIPTEHINGIAAMTINNLVYIPQVYANTGKEKAHTDAKGVYLDHINAKDAKTKKDLDPNYIASDSEKAYFHVSPSLGVRNQDIELPSFESITSTNTTRASLTKINDPIQAVSYNIDGDGILTVNYTKSTTKQITVTNPDVTNSADGTEKFTMVSLKVPVAKANWTKEEVTAGNPVYVNSEYARLQENYFVPYLMHGLVKADQTLADEFPNETVAPDAARKSDIVTKDYVHYHDSLCLYTSDNKELVDFEAPYNAPFNLNDKVKVCLTEIESLNKLAQEAADSHVGKDGKHDKILTAKEAASYGLAFRFDVAKAAYNQGSLKTNEQEFAQLTGDVKSADYGMLTSKVYTVGNDGQSRTAIGREPIIRVRLIDTKNGNALIAQRYIKVRWSEVKSPEQTIPAKDLGALDVWCYDMFRQLATKEMNEDVYHMVNIPNADGSLSSQSISKEKFHEIYTAVEVVSLKKDGVEIIKDGAPVKMLKNGALVALKTAGARDITIAGTEAERADISPKLWNYGTKPQDVDGKEDIVNDEDLMFGFLKDDTESNTSYNIVWAMSPELVGTVKDGGSKFEIAVKYISKDAAYGSVNQTFTQTINVPEQTFNYQGTYWKDGQPMAGTGVFNVNPLVYKTAVDGDVTAAAHVPGEFAHNLNDWSHIEADLMNGWTYVNGKTKPANLSEFIQKIRDCATVKFVFDADRFAKYDNLKGYKVDATGTQLWYVADPKATIAPATEDGLTDYLNDHISSKDFTDEAIIDYKAAVDEVNAKKAVVKSLAATINNHLYSTAKTNKNDKNLVWNFEEVLNGNAINGFSQGKEGADADAAYAVIRLHENNDYDGTYAAKAQIGQKVPVNLVVEYNDYNKVAVQKFEVFFIEPLTIDGGLGDNFKDAVINGDFLEIGKNFTFTDWNKYSVASAPFTAKKGETLPEKKQYAHQLYDYYCVKNVVFDTDKTTTCLKLNGATWIATEGVTDGPMPAGAMLKMMDWSADAPNFTDKTKAVEVAANPTHLAYFNEAGTPVDFQYHLFVDVNVEYKWGTMSKKGLPILVVPADGTPTNADHK